MNISTRVARIAVRLLTVMPALLLAACGFFQAAAAIQAAEPSAYVPQKHILFYAEFDGVARHADAWKNTAAYRSLAETGLDVMLAEVAGQAVSHYATDTAASGQRIRPQDLAALAQEVLQSGFVAGICATAESPRIDAVILVAPGLGKPQNKGKVVELITALGFTEIRDSSGENAYLLKGGQGLIGGKNAVRKIWFDGVDLVMAAGPGDPAAAAIAAKNGKIPNMSSHLKRKTLRESKTAGRPVLIGFMDYTPFQKVYPPQITAFGLDNLGIVDTVIGLKGPAIVTVTNIQAPSPRKGVFQFADQPPFRLKTMPPVPANVGNFACYSLDLKKFLDDATGLAAILNPDAPALVEQVFGQIRDQTGIDFRKDVFGQIGPRSAVYVLPADKSDGLNMLVMSIPNIVAVAEVKDANAFLATLDKVMAVVNAPLKTIPSPVAASGFRQTPAGAVRLEFRKLKGKYAGYVLRIPPGFFPLPAGIQPTIAVGKSFLVLAINPEAARTVLDVEASPNLGWSAQPANVLPLAEIDARDMTALIVTDPRDITPHILTNLPAIVQCFGMATTEPTYNRNKPPFVLQLDPEMIPSVKAIQERLFPNTFVVGVNDQGIRIVSRSSLPGVGAGAESLPTVAPVAVGMLLPAVQSVRENARRAQCSNHLKQIGLAMHNHVSATESFPARAIFEKKTGKALLSWRVAILPYLGEAELYQQFRLDEPWDSPHNRPLAEKMPQVYQCPSDIPIPGKTGYAVFTGEGAPFDKDVGIKFEEFLDGTSNTILVAETREKVIWTKPEDIPNDANLLNRVGGMHPGGFNSLNTDGSVRFLRSSINLNLLKALLSPRGGETVNSDDL